MLFKKENQYAKEWFVDINPFIEKEKYTIFSDLEKYGKSIIEKTDEKPWWNSVARELGVQTKDTKIDGKRIILPPISNQDHHFGVIITNKNIVVIEEKLDSISRFKIKRI
jgi:hypothetical protein